MMLNQHRENHQKGTESGEHFACHVMSEMSFDPQMRKLHLNLKSEALSVTKPKFND